MVCTIVQRQLLGKIGLLSAGLQQKAHQLQEHIGNYFSGTQQAFSLVVFPLATSHPLPAPRRTKLKLEFIQLYFFFFESPDLKSERDWRKKMLKNRQHRKLILNETCPTFAFMSSTKCSLRTRYTQRNVIYCNSDQYQKHVHPHGSFNLHLHLELVYISCKHYFSPKQAAYTFPKVSSTAQKRVEAGNKNPLLLELTLWLKNVLEWKPSVCIQTPLSDSY